MLVRLHFEPRAYQRHVDRPWLQLLRPETSPLDYRRMLARTYGLEGPLEAAVAYTPMISTLADLRRCFATGQLAEDLLVLGLKPGELAKLPQCMIAPFHG